MLNIILEAQGCHILRIYLSMEWLKALSLVQGICSS